MCWEVIQTLIMSKITNGKGSALETVKTTKKKIPLLFVPLIIMKLFIFLIGIAINENRQDTGFQHKCGFKAAHVLGSATVAHSAVHLPTYTNIHLHAGVVTLISISTSAAASLLLQGTAL